MLSPEQVHLCREAFATDSVTAIRDIGDRHPGIPFAPGEITHQEMRDAIKGIYYSALPFVVEQDKEELWQLVTRVFWEELTKAGIPS